MSELAIRVEGLGKHYRIGGPKESYGMLRDSLMSLVKAPLRAVRGEGSTGQREFWALRDVSFEVQRGEVLGVIGRNGAGKSTLLKILSRITEPTTGYAEIHGRVGSLLEVGTGFHPELTGRENIYLNGAILGMKKAEIERAFDEIVAFAEIEQFLDTPVKRYSSGMYMRLAFSIAAHLEPEILIVDEVLAVGDAAFQKKCLGKMGDVAREGRTVLFVSHSMEAVLSLCHTAQLLQGGALIYRGAPSDVIARFTEKVASQQTISLAERPDREGDGSVRLTSIEIRNGNGETTIHCGDSLDIAISYTSNRELTRPVFCVDIFDQFNRQIFYLSNRFAGGLSAHLPASGVVRCLTGPINLTSGSCIVDVAVIVAGNTMADHVRDVLRFEVEPDDFFGTGKLTQRKDALCLIDQKWTCGG